MCPKRDLKEAHFSTLTSWIKCIIADTYARFPKDHAAVLLGYAHKIRVLAASLAW